RLGVGGQVELFLRPVGDQAPKVLAQCLGSFGDSAGHDRIAGKAVQHADRLRALPGKQESKFAHGVLFLCFYSITYELDYMRASTAPQVKPPPTPSISTLSPGLTRPSRTAWSSASGIDAAEVLPCWSTVTTIFSSGR